MTLNHWVLALHLLSAFTLAASLILFWVVIIVLRRTGLPEVVASVARLLPVGTVAVTVGSLGVIIFGVWLAISVDRVQVWDGWVIAAIVLWAAAFETGKRAGAEFALCVDHANLLLDEGKTGPDARLAELARTGRGRALHAASTAAVILILADMIWKPGA